MEHTGARFTVTVLSVYTAAPPLDAMTRSVYVPALVVVTWTVDEVVLPTNVAPAVFAPTHDQLKLALVRFDAGVIGRAAQRRGRVPVAPIQRARDVAAPGDDHGRTRGIEVDLHAGARRGVHQAPLADVAEIRDGAVVDRHLVLAGGQRSEAGRESTPRDSSN